MQAVEEGRGGKEEEETELVELGEEEEGVGSQAVEEEEGG